MTDDAQNGRREWDEKRKATERHELPPFENVEAVDHTEFEPFEDMARKLIQTPKQAED